MSGTGDAWRLFATHTVVIQALTFVLRPAGVYQAVETGLPTQWIGLLAAAFAILPLLLAVPAGMVADRIGEKKMMLGGAILVLAASAIFLWVGSHLVGILIATAALGAAHLVATVGQHAYVARTSARSEYDRVFATYGLNVSLGQALGPGLLVVFGGDGRVPDVDAIFWTGVLAGGLAIVATCGIPSRRSPPEGARTPLVSAPALAKVRGMIRAIVVGSLLLAAIDITVIFVPALGAERGFSVAWVGALLAGRAIASMISRLFMRSLLAAVGGRALLVYGTFATAVGLVVIAIAWTPAVAVVGVIAVGLGFGVAQPITMSWVASLAPDGSHGRAMSMRLTGNRLGQLTVPLAVAAVLSESAAGVLTATAVLTCGTGLLAIRRSGGTGRRAP